MGFMQDAANAVRKWFADDKEKRALETQRGVQPKRSRLGQSWSLFNRTGYEGLAEHLRIEHDLLTRYFDYEEMDDFPEISTAMDIYADDSTQTDTLRRKAVWVVSEDERYKEIGNDLLHKQLRIEEDLHPLSRTLTKYGNAYGELLVNKDGVIGINFLPPPTMRRVEDYNGALLGFYQDPDGRGISLEDFRKLLDEKGRLKGAPRPTNDFYQAGARHAGGFTQPSMSTNLGTNQPTELIPFEDWEVVHWRLRSKHMRSIYGHSVLEPARWVWRRLVLLEDAAILYKLTRAPARYAFYIDTGDLPPAQAMAHVNEIKKGYKKKKFVDKEGNLDFRVNPLAVDEDFWVPMRGGKESTRIDILSGPDWQSMEDLQYFRQKLMTAIKVPPAYIGLQEGETRASLSQEDVRFARTVLRIQRELRNGLKKVLRVHYAAIGMDPHGAEWDVEMTAPSSIFELAQIETRNAQADLAGNLEPYFDKQWILTKVFNLSDDEAADLLKRQDQEQEDVALRAAEIQKKQAEVFPGAAGAELPQPAPGEPGASANAAGGGQAGGGEQPPQESKDLKARFDNFERRARALLGEGVEDEVAEAGSLQESGGSGVVRWKKKSANG
jgi:hypothetical protein